MSLVDAFMEECVLMERERVSDGEGGLKPSGWKEGASIRCAITLDTSISARIAEREGVKNLYTITTKRSVNLDYHDVIKRVSDGKYFRITSDGSDKHTPNVTSLDMRQMTAEKWELTS